jgi:hypothetical protein
MRSTFDVNPAGNQNSDSFHRALVTKLFGMVAPICIMASSVCTGIWLGARIHRPNPASPPVSRHNQSVRMTASVCQGARAAASSEVPLGYSLIDVRRIGSDCFALLRADDSKGSPGLGLSMGTADVFGPDGRLMLRFFAIGRPDGRWDVFQYRRVQVHDGSRLGPRSSLPSG